MIQAHKLDLRTHALEEASSGTNQAELTDLLTSVQGFFQPYPFPLGQVTAPLCKGAEACLLEERPNGLRQPPSSTTLTAELYRPPSGRIHPRAG